jgi:hypothetical protein
MVDQEDAYNADCKVNYYPKTSKLLNVFPQFESIQVYLQAAVSSGSVLIKHAIPAALIYGCRGR